MFRNYKNITITTDEVILVEDWSYFEKALALYEDLKITQKRNLKNFLMWKFIGNYFDSLPKRYREVEQDYEKVVNGVSTPPSRSVTCVTVVLQKMEFIAGRMYVEEYFDKSIRETFDEQVEYIQNEFIRALEQNDWMDRESKAKAIEKAKTMQRKIGYPDFLFDDAYIKVLYKEFQFGDDNYFINQLTFLKAKSDEELKDLREEKSRTRWIMHVAEINAFYSRNLNQIRIPAGILKAPVYDVNHPNYLNFGGIGMVIGHEITHGFDDIGRLYDKEGVFYGDDTLELWSNATIQNYKNRVQCIIDQYNKFYVKSIGRYANGFLTQGENIADNGGLKQAFYAYQEWVRKNKPEPRLPGLSNFTPNQLFFINYAQMWCEKLREPALLQYVLTSFHSLGEYSEFVGQLRILMNLQRLLDAKQTAAIIQIKSAVYGKRNETDVLKQTETTLRIFLK